MHTEFISYEDGKIILEASVAYPAVSKQPIVIVCHAWNGRDGFIQETIEKVAGWGFVGFALDVYGKGILGRSKEENLRLKTPFLEDRIWLKHRLMKGIEVARSLKNGDETKIAVMGFGFGGLCALDLVRSDAHLKGAISLYGHFEEAEGLKNHAIQAKVLLLHGAGDPIVPLQDLEDFGRDLSRYSVDWQAHIYGQTIHAFINPKANDPANGVQYQPISAARAWKAVVQFLQEEVFDKASLLRYL